MYKRFIQKSYPIHLISFIAAALMQAFWLQRWFSVPGFYDAVKRAIPNLLLIHSLIPDANYYYAYNAVSWYLSCLAILYLVLPMLIRIVKKISGGIRALICTVALYVFVSFVAGQSGANLQWLLYISPIMRSFDFVIGMLIAKTYIINGDADGNYRGLDLIGVTLFIVGMFCYGKVPEWFAYSLIFLPGSILMIIGVTINASKLMKRVLSIKLFEYANMISLELYLTHQIIINYLDHYNTDVTTIPNGIYYPLIIIGTLVISCFIRILFDKNTALRIKDGKN